MLDSVKCFECNAANSETARTCVKCSASLRPALAQLHLDRAEVDVNKGSYQQASKNMAKADAEMLVLSSDERDKYMLTARAFWLQGSIYYYKGMMQEAEQELLLAQRNLEQHPNSAELLALVLNRLGGISYYANRPDEAADLFHRSSDLAMQVGAYATASKAIGNIGILLANNEPNEAIVFYKQAEVQAEASNDPNVLAQICRSLARFYANHGPYHLARAYADKGLVISSQLDDLYVRCLNLDTAAVVHLRLGDIEEATTYLHEAYDLTRRTNNKMTTEAVMLTLGELMRYDKYNEPWFEQAMKEFNETIGGALAKGRYALQMSYYYIRQEDWARVRRFLQQLSQIDISKISQGYPILITCAQALLHASLGEWEAASVQYEDAIDSGKLSRYDLAVTWEDYAAMLLRHAEVIRDSPGKDSAHNAFKQAASLYQELELPRRAAMVEARLAAISGAL